MFEYPTINMKKTGGRIEELRLKNDLSVKALQELLGLCSAQAIYKWQRGESLPDVDHLIALSQIFQVPVEEILIVGDDTAKKSD